MLPKNNMSTCSTALEARVPNFIHKIADFMWICHCTFQPRWKIPGVSIFKNICGFWGTLFNEFTSQNWVAIRWKAVFIFEHFWCGKSSLFFYWFVTGCAGWLRLAKPTPLFSLSLLHASTRPVFQGSTLIQFHHLDLSDLMELNSMCNLFFLSWSRGGG